MCKDACLDGKATKNKEMIRYYTSQENGNLREVGKRVIGIGFVERASELVGTILIFLTTMVVILL